MRLPQKPRVQRELGSQTTSRGQNERFVWLLCTCHLLSLGVKSPRRTRNDPFTRGYTQESVIFLQNVNTKVVGGRPISAVLLPGCWLPPCVHDRARIANRINSAQHRDQRILRAHLPWLEAWPPSWRQSFEPAVRYYRFPLACGQWPHPSRLSNA